MRSATRHHQQFIGAFVKRLIAQFRWNNSQVISSNENLLDLLEQARKEWTHAKLYFNNVTDPDLIDHAIFYMGATEKKYIYLLKRAREIGISTESFSYND